MPDFIPAKIEKTVISIRLPVNMLYEIDKISANVDISRNEFIMQCINFAVENYKTMKSE